MNEAQFIKYDAFLMHNYDSNLDTIRVMYESFCSNIDLYKNQILHYPTINKKQLIINWLTRCILMRKVCLF